MWVWRGRVKSRFPKRRRAWRRETRHWRNRSRRRRRTERENVAFSWSWLSVPSFLWLYCSPSCIVFVTNALVVHWKERVAAGNQFICPIDNLSRERRLIIQACPPRFWNGWGILHHLDGQIEGSDCNRYHRVVLANPKHVGVEDDGPSHLHGFCPHTEWFTIVQKRAKRMECPHFKHECAQNHLLALNNTLLQLIISMSESWTQRLLLSELFIKWSSICFLPAVEDVSYLSSLIAHLWCQK